MALQRLLANGPVKAFLFFVVASLAWDSAGANDDPIHSQNADSARPIDQFWTDAQINLFVEIDLTEAQQKEIDRIVADAARDRERFAEASRNLKQARADGDVVRSKSLSTEIGELRKRFKPKERTDALRAVLTDDHQLEIFDRNRRLQIDRLRALGAGLRQKPEAPPGPKRPAPLK
jgi:hypothetical protein